MNPEEQKAIERLEKLKSKKEKLDRRIREEQCRLSREERKKRTQRLIQFGGLGEIAGLTEKDKGMILGGLFAMAKAIRENPETAQAWKQYGDSMLKQREDRRRTS